MRCCAQWIKANALAFALSAVIAVLVCLLFATDRRLGLHQFASTRYRFHAIPVAISTLYHHRPHDYTAMRTLAHHFHNPTRDLDEQIQHAIHPDYDPGNGSYFWVADDRGLADYVIGAFWLFGPETLSLSNFLFVVLGLALALYAIGYWHTPAALMLPLVVVFGWLALAQVMLHRVPFPNGQGYWGEEIALYESRMFDLLALVSVLHLAVLAAAGPSVSRLAWAMAIPQAAILVFLYHARSSIGWQYLALFALVAVRFGAWAAQRLRDTERAPRSILARPFFVALVLAFSLIGLKQYQRAAYHRHYTSTYGQRTFWHNALMGLAYHPRLRDELPMALCDDRNAVDLVLARMEERDPNLDKNQWNWQAALNSLGNHNAFDWNRYEGVARGIYFDLWRSRPTHMAECYGYYKPRDISRQIRLTAVRIEARAETGGAPELVFGLCLLLAAFAGVIGVARLDAGFRASFRSHALTVAIVIPFSLIPGIAFYPAITTVSCFYLLSLMLGSLLSINLCSWLLKKPVLPPVDHAD